MPIDPTLARPAAFDPGNPLADMTTYLNNALMMDKIGEAKVGRQRIANRNALMKRHVKPDGTYKLGDIVYDAAQNEMGYDIPDIEEEIGKIDKLRSETAENTATAQKSQAETVVKMLEADKEMLGSVRTPQQLIEHYQQRFNDPILGPYMRSRGMDPDKTLAHIQQIRTPEQLNQFILAEQGGLDKVLKSHYVETNQGGTGAIYRMPEFGTAPPTKVAEWDVTKDPNRSAGHWVEDYDPKNHTVTHRPATPGMVTRPKPTAANTPPEVKELQERAKAAAILATEITRQTGVRVKVHPETAQIEIEGGNVLNPWVRNKIDNIARNLAGGALISNEGTNPRVDLQPNTTSTGVTARVRQDNTLTYERGENGVERLVPKAPGVIRQPVAEKEKSPVELRARARSQAIQAAKDAALMGVELDVDILTEAYYQDYLKRPGAGYGGPSLRDQLKSDGMLK